MLPGPKKRDIPLQNCSTQPVRVLQLFYNTVAWQGESLYSGMLGESLGNRDAVLNTPYVVIYYLQHAW